jgi:nicotinamide-nucleotide amidase
MFEEQVLPRLRAGPTPRRRVWRFCGIAESAADKRLAPVLRAFGRNAAFTILASPGAVELHCAARTAALLDRIEARIAKALGPSLYGRDGDTLESKLGKALRRRGWTLAAAESCTGGLFSERVTSVPGSSAYFLGGVLAYADAAKKTLLGVRPETLARHGAVSAACAREMAKGVRASLGSDIGVSITGIAGPSGGSRAKPAGLVFLGLSSRSGTLSRRLLFRGDRAGVRSRAASAALHQALKLTAAFIKR